MRVWSRRGDDQLVSLPVIEEIGTVAQGILIARSIGRGQLHHRLAADAAHPGLHRGPGHLLLKVVHVGKASNPAEQHFGAGELRSQEAELGVHELALDGQDVAVQPHVETQVVGQAAQQCHGQMRVGVHQPRHDNVPRAIDDRRGLINSLDRPDAADRHDVAAVNRHRPRRQDLAPGVHGQHGATPQDDIGRLAFDVVLAIGHGAASPRCAAPRPGLRRGTL